MSTLFTDIKYVCRTLAGQPLFTAVAVGILTLGIAGMTTMFSLYKAVCLHPLPFPHPERVVKLSDWNHEGYAGAYNVYMHLKANNTTFETMAGYAGWSGGELLLDGRIEGVPVMRSTPELFDIFGIRPLLGRVFTAEEDHPDASGVVLLSHGFWQRAFNGDKNVLGRVLQISQRPYRILGVLPKDIGLLEGQDLWIPLAGNPAKCHMEVLGRLDEGIGCKQAQQDIKRIIRNKPSTPNDIHRTEPTVLLAQKDYTEGYRRTTLFYLGAVSLVLLVVCSNLSGILLARSIHRSRELGIRIAMGATRMRIVQLVLCESLVLSVLGVAFGLLLGRWILSAQIAWLNNMIPPWTTVIWDAYFLAFCLALVVVTTLTSGLLPAIHTPQKQRIQAMLPCGTLTTSPPHLRRSLHAIVIGEIALALSLLVGAGLLWRSYDKMQRVDPGIRTQDVLFYRLGTSGSQARGRVQWHAFFHDHLAKVRALPGIKKAALTYMAPLQYKGDTDNRILCEGGRKFSPGEGPEALKHIISSNYLKTLDIKLLSGRDFSQQDTHPDSAPTVIISRRLAETCWPQTTALGKRLAFESDSPIWCRVIGVVEDTRFSALDSPLAMELYLPYTPANCGRSNMQVVLHTSLTAAQLATPIHQMAQSAAPGEPPPNINSLAERAHHSLRHRHGTSLPYYAFAIVATMIAIGGIYGVTAYTMSQRTQEFGIRLALGAQRYHIIKQVLRQSAGTIAIGLGCGLFGALIISMVFSSMVFGVSPFDSVTYLGIPTLLAAVTLLACYLPARRAAKIDPMEALRYE